MIDTKQLGKTAIITLNRPDSLNALNFAGLTELETEFTRLDNDPEVATIVITGSGEKSFCAGGDITEFTENHSLDHALYSGMQKLYQQIHQSKTPTIAAVNGYALGGGFELALACDLRIASSTASFALPELGISILPAAGGTQRLSRLIGPGRAMDLILTGRRITAEQAFAWGVVTELVDAAELLERAEALALAIQSKGPIAVKLARILVKSAADVAIDTGLAMEALAQAVVYSSEDLQEGSAAFSQKRKPNFKGR